MHWLAKSLFSTNRQKCQQFSTICPGNWETSRVPGRRTNYFCVPALHVLLGWKTQHTFWLESIFIMFIAYTFQAFSRPQTWQTNKAFLTMGSTVHCHPYNAAAYKFHQNILSFLTFTPWIAMEIQTEHWQWTSFHKNDFFYLLFLNLVRIEHSFCVMVSRW